MTTKRRNVYAMAAKKARKKKRKIRINTFESLYRYLCKNIELRQVSVETVGGFASKYDKKYNEERKSIYKKIVKQKRTPTYKDMKSLVRLQKKHPAQEMLFSRNTITSTVSVIDFVFGQVLRNYYERNPERLSSENRTISYGELKKQDSVKNALDHMISREIDQILLREGVQSRLKILKDELELVVPQKTEHVNKFYKLIKIRNLIVHNSCQADSEYSKKYSDKTKVKVGDSIHLNKDYLHDALATALFFCGVILQSAQLKFPEKNVTGGSYIMNDVMHELLKIDQFDYVNEIYKLADELELDDLNQKMIIVNYCIGLKKQGKTARKIEKELDKHDWSLIEPESDFQLALFALKGQDKDFYKLLETLIKKKKIKEEEILDWQIFSLYNRKTKYREILKKTKVVK